MNKSSQITAIPLVRPSARITYEQLQKPFYLKVYFSMAINRYQRKTHKFVGIDLRENCFLPGQFFVACSRVSSLYILDV